MIFREMGEKNQRHCFLRRKQGLPLSAIDRHRNVCQSTREFLPSSHEQRRRTDCCRYLVRNHHRAPSTLPFVHRTPSIAPASGPTTSSKIQSNNATYKAQCNITKTKQ